jgi:hypothetical protein
LIKSKTGAARSAIAQIVILRLKQDVQSDGRNLYRENLRTERAAELAEQEEREEREKTARKARKAEIAAMASGKSRPSKSGESSPLRT